MEEERKEERNFQSILKVPGTYCSSRCRPLRSLISWLEAPAFSSSQDPTFILTFLPPTEKRKSTKQSMEWLTVCPKRENLQFSWISSLGPKPYRGRCILQPLFQNPNQNNQYITLEGARVIPSCEVEIWNISITATTTSTTTSILLHGIYVFGSLGSRRVLPFLIWAHKVSRATKKANLPVDFHLGPPLCTLRAAFSNPLHFWWQKISQQQGTVERRSGLVIWKMR